MSLLNFRKNVPVTINQKKDNPFLSVQNELNRAMRDFYEGWFEPFNYPSIEIENMLICPAINVVEDKAQLKIEAEMPGMGAEDVKVDINNNVLTIKGEKTVSQKNKDKNYTVREINYGSYERRMTLPEGLDTTKANSSFKKGMLWVIIPKLPETVKAQKTIEVKSAE